MNSLFVIFCVLLCISNAKSDESQNDTEKWPTLKPEYSYCYEFTWFGPDWTNATRYNGTCADYLEETRADGIPCASPIVITYNGKPPNMNYLWDNYRSSILCIRGANQRCVKYTYYLDNMINNVTHMCSKVQDVDGKIISDGCYKEKTVNGYQREVCVSKSSIGVYPPPNGVPINTFCLSLIMICIFVLSSVR